MEGGGGGGGGQGAGDMLGSFSTPAVLVIWHGAPFCAGEGRYLVVGEGGQLPDHVLSYGRVLQLVRLKPVAVCIFEKKNARAEAPVLSLQEFSEHRRRLLSPELAWVHGDEACRLAGLVKQRLRRPGGYHGSIGHHNACEEGL